MGPITLSRIRILSVKQQISEAQGLVRARGSFRIQSIMCEVCVCCFSAYFSFLAVLVLPIRSVYGSTNTNIGFIQIPSVGCTLSFFKLCVSQHYSLSHTEYILQSIACVAIYSTFYLAVLKRKECAKQGKTILFVQRFLKLIYAVIIRNKGKCCVYILLLYNRSFPRECASAHGLNKYSHTYKRDMNQCSRTIIQQKGEYSCLCRQQHSLYILF